MVNKSRVFWITLVVLAIFLSPGCSKKSTKPEPPKYKWTILGYFDGNNSQDLDPVTLGSYVIQDVQEMEQVGSTKDVQIIVMLGSIKTEGNCNYYFLDKYLDEPADSISSKVLDSLGKKDMSDPQTLRDFIQYGATHYSAQRYMLVLNDHGSGWKGVFSDEQNGDGKMMSLPELSSALSGYKFEIIVSNAPSMSMLEVAYQLRDKANYLIASQFKSPVQNLLGFSNWLQGLAEDPDIRSRDLARSIVDTIYWTADNKHKEISIAAINLSKVENLASKVANLGDSLMMKVGAYWNEVLDAWNTVHSQKYDDSAFTDLREFAKKIQESPNLDSVTAKAVEDATDDAIVNSLANRDYPRGGLSIYFPWKASLFDSTNYVQLEFVSFNWHIFLSHFIASSSGYLGGLRILSHPVQGARIFLNGEDTGLETDTTILGLLPVEYQIKVVKPGWRELAPQYHTVESGTIKTVVFSWSAITSSSPTQTVHWNFQQE